MQRDIVLILHDIRSCHNVGSLLRTAEGIGVTEVIFSGYTPFPKSKNDPRLPHIAAKLDRQIHKTALGAESVVTWSRSPDLQDTLRKLTSDGYVVCALEQHPDSIELPRFQPPQQTAILLGREVEGTDPVLLKLCETIVEIPMHGQKESFNVVQAAAMMLYHCRYTAP